MSRPYVRFGVVLTGSVALVVGGGPVAFAHVSVHADGAVRGGSSEIAFRVPTESDTASTITVEVAFPADTPVAKVAVLPLPGWTHRVTTTTPSSPVPAGHGQEVVEVVSRIQWHATGPDTAVEPGEYQVFRVAAGPLPETDRLVFKVVQTYDDGEVKRWIDEPVASGPEPAHPAPVLALATGSASGHHHGEAAPVGQDTPVAAQQAVAPAPAWWSAVALALMAMLAALGAVVIAVRTSRRGGGEVSSS